MTSPRSIVLSPNELLSSLVDALPSPPSEVYCRRRIPYPTALPQRYTIIPSPLGDPSFIPPSKRTTIIRSLVHAPWSPSPASNHRPRRGSNDGSPVLNRPQPHPRCLVPFLRQNFIVRSPIHAAWSRSSVETSSSVPWSPSQASNHCIFPRPHSLIPSPRGGSIVPHGRCFFSSPLGYHRPFPCPRSFHRGRCTISWPTGLPSLPHTPVNAPKRTTAVLNPWSLSPVDAPSSTARGPLPPSPLSMLYPAPPLPHPSSLPDPRPPPAQWRHLGGGLGVVSVAGP